VAEFSLRGPGSCGDEPCCDEHRGDERGGDGSWPGGTGGGVPGSWADGLPFAGMMVAVPVPPDAYGTDSLAGIGPDGFADGGPLDVMPPGPLLEMLTELAQPHLRSAGRRDRPNPRERPGPRAALGVR
jgi:hypothetical protein